MCSSMPGPTDTNRSYPQAELSQLHQHRCMVARGLALALLADDLGVRDALGKRGRGEDEVDAHAAVLGESQLCVVPVGVDRWSRRERSYHIDELSIDDCVERCALRR